METLAHWEGGGPGPWVLFFPLIWAAVIVGVVTLLRRTGRLGRGRGPHASRESGPDAQSPITVLGHRFASGEIDEEEYWRRLSVLDEQFGRAYGTGGRGTKGGAA
ncbi:SHOCT domain-containing protein [Streptomyces cavernicola]|uniref:SHOCT domain-containing protein n=1 Tax=Streptomyces cavernicola TaxID=3043613 RepID=A0ABT6S9F2_9ACTN|nr:SHOCT domain-containing protein [Streptomyces sp. B-S-A6]MDI3404728.1 SHOCT domain-containing protein [Streptomyces sp. B-S-A6]